MQLRLYITLLTALTFTPGQSFGECTPLRNIIPGYFKGGLDGETFDSEKLRISERLNNKTLKFSELKNASFETRLAALEVMSPNILNEGESMKEVFESLSVLKRRRLQKSLKSLYQTRKPISQIDVDYKIEDIYLDYLHSRYPGLSKGLSDEAVEKMLHDIVQARLIGKNVGDAMKDMGLIKNSAGKFEAYLDQVLKGHGPRAVVDTPMNGLGLYQMARGNFRLGLLMAPPQVRMQRWVKIPEDMLKRAATEGLENVWQDGLKDYLVKQSGGWMKTDLVYHQIQRLWRNAVNVAFAYSYYEVVKDSVSNEFKAVQEFKRDHKSPGLKDRKNKLSTADQERNWNNWKASHPKEASDPNSTEAKFMHEIFFGS